jgi:hypothetical protein
VNADRRVVLHDIAHARTGDKGEVTNICVFPFDDGDYDLLRARLTAAAVKEHFGDLVAGEVVRYEVPSLCGLNFVLHGTRPGGVAAALQLDTHGKALSYGLLSMEIERAG